MIKKKLKRLTNNKKFFISTGVVLASAFALSLGACKFSLPKSMDIVMPKATYEVPLGKINTDKYFSSKDFYDQLNDINSQDFKVYDYIENGTSRDMIFLIEYDLKEIPIDFGEQLKKLDMDQKLSENLVQTIKIDKPTMPTPTSASLNLNTTILDKMKATLTSIPTFPITGGMSSAQTLEILGPTINFTDPEFATASFTSGSLDFTITPSSPDPSLVFTTKGKIVDYDTRRVITETQGTAVDCASGGTLSFPLTGKVFPKKTQIVLTATVNNPGSTTTCNSSATFTNEKLDRLTGVNMASISTIILNNTITFDAGCPLASTILDSGSKVTIQAAAPDGWSGIECVITGDSDQKVVTGGLTIEESEFKPGNNPGSYFIDKVAKIEGQKLTPDTINIVGDIAINLVNATVVVPPSGIVDVSVNVNCDITKLRKTIVKKDKIFNSGTMTSTFGKSLGTDANKYIKQVSFEKIDLLCDFTGSDLPRNNLDVDATFTSTNLGIDGTGKSMTPDPVKLGNDFTLSSPPTDPTGFYVLANHADPLDSSKKGYVDAQVEIEVSDPDTTIGEGNISFEEFVLGKEYTLKTTVQSKFYFNQIHLNASEMGAQTEGKKKTNLDINKLFEEAVQEGLKQEELDKLYFAGGRTDVGGSGTTAYLYVAKPTTTSEDDPFKDFKFKAKIQPMDIDETKSSPDPDYYVPIEYSDSPGEKIFFKGAESGAGEFETLDIKSDVLNLSGFSKVVDGKNVVTERKSKIFKPGSYSERIEEFADALNKKPKNLTISYDLTILGVDSAESTPGSGVIVITGAQYDEMKKAADKDELKSMSIQMKLVIYLPMAFKINDKTSGKGFTIDDIADIGGDPLSDDFLGRDGKDDFDDFRKYIDSVSTMSLIYRPDYWMNSTLTLNLVDKVGAGAETKLSKPLSLATTSENTLFFSKSDINLILNSYPLIPKISLFAKHGDTVKIPREMHISLKSQMVTEEGHHINVW